MRVRTLDIACLELDAHRFVERESKLINGKKILRVAHRWPAPYFFLVRSDDCCSCYVLLDPIGVSRRAKSDEWNIPSVHV